MTDPKIDIKKFVAKEEDAAKAWLGSNWIPFACGLVVGICVTLVLYRI